MEYYIYCRKSTDSEERQLLSLDAQERESLLLAEKYNLKVKKIFKESMSAKAPGRPIFNSMLDSIRKEKGYGLICWKLDRLARNLADGGLLIDLLQNGVIKEIITSDGKHLPTDDVFSIAMQFGMSNQFVRNLSKDVKRGNREKLARGEWPNHAPFGYLNDKTTKTIIVDQNNFHFVQKAFELYLTGIYSFQDISAKLYEEGLRTKSGKKVHKGPIQRMISNPFYSGIMVRDGKHYIGKHEPLISKESFDKAQLISENRSRPRSKHLFFPLRGFLKCDNCGCALTASLKKGHHYYYCTNGKKICDEHKSYIRENSLYEMIATIFDTLHFSERKIELMYEAALERQGMNEEYVARTLQNYESRLKSLTEQESRLLDAYIGGQIHKELYDQKALGLQNERISLNQSINALKAKRASSTLEPIKNIFLTASKAKKAFLEANDIQKQSIVKNLLWNLSIKNKNVASIQYKSPYDILVRTSKNSTISELLPD